MNFECKGIGLKESCSCSEKENLIEICACGVDVWGKKDEFAFYYVPVKGDFCLTVRIESFEKSDLYAKAGIMARANTEENGAHVFFTAFPDNAKRHKNNGGYEFQYREKDGGKSFAVYPADCKACPPAYPVGFPDAWLKLVRKGNTFSAYCCADGQNWKLYCDKQVNLPEEVNVGLSVTAHSKKAKTKVVFGDLNITK